MISNLCIAHNTFFSRSFGSVWILYLKDYMKANNKLRGSKLYNSIIYCLAVMFITALVIAPFCKSFYSYAATEDVSDNSEASGRTNIFIGEEESTDLTNNKERNSTRVVKVGYYIIDGFMMFEEPDIYSGYCYDYLQKIRSYTGWEYDYIGDDEKINFDDLYQMTVDGEIDLIGGITWTEERAKNLIYSNVPIEMEYTTIYVKKDDATYSAGSYSKWNGIKIGLVRGTNYVSNIKDFANSNYFTYKANYYDTDEEMVEALNNGEIDAFVSGSSHNFSDVSILAQFNPSYLFFATGLGNQDLMNTLNQALSQIETVDSGFKESLNFKYYQGNGVRNINFTSTENLYLKSIITNERKFVLLANPDNCPLSYLDENGNPTGILVDMAKAILDSIGLSYEFYIVDTRENYIHAINDRKADIIIDYASDFSRSEKEGYYECNTYFNTSLTNVHQKNYNEFDTVIKREGDGIFKNTILEYLSGTENVLLLESIDATKDYIVNNTGACTLMPTEVAGVMVKQEETNALIADEISYRNIDYCFAVNSDCGNYLIGIFNKACESFSTIDSAEIISAYDPDNYRNNSFKAFIYDNPVYGFMIVIAGVIIFFLLNFIYVGKRNRKHVENLNKQLTIALDGEKKAAAAKKKFFDDMSHDMRTPLNGILGLTRSVIKNGESVIDNQDYLHKIEDSASYLELLINDILVMSTLGKVEYELDLKTVDPGEVFESIKNVALLFAQERDIRIVLRRKEIVNLPTILDYSRLEQAVLNVIANAVKFSHANGTVEIDLTSRMLEDNKVEYTLNIQDHGIGMSKEFQESLFDGHSKEDRGEMTDHAGAGIGLSVVKNIVEKMDGRIEIKSKENLGTIVTLIFVFEVNPGSIVEELLDSKYEEVSLKGINVLYCEDNELNMDIVCAILESEDANVEKAWNGQEGLDKFVNSPPNTYDAILMDIRMPVMDGLSAASKIRESQKEDSKTIPIIAVSANAFEDDKKASKEAGMNAHLSKPVDPKILINELKKYI